MISLTSKELIYLRSAEAVTERSQYMLQYCLSGNTHFTIDWGKFKNLSENIATKLLNNYSDLNIPLHARWRHFEFKNDNRASLLKKTCFFSNKKDQVKSQIDLIVISVLLDAGAGENWRYFDIKSNEYFYRSEGLALASLHLFFSGFFSASHSEPFRVDAQKLKQITLDDFLLGLQISETNQLLGQEGRFKLLKNLAENLFSKKQYFITYRPGDLYEYIQSSYGNSICASELLSLVLLIFSNVWPSQLIANIKNSNVIEPLGDIGLYHPWQNQFKNFQIQSTIFTPKKDFFCLIPFHKLSLWLTLSLIEPLQYGDIEVTHLEELPGLAEYRNGGLFVDSEVLNLKNVIDQNKTYQINDLLIIEWRALTLALLEQLNLSVRYRLGWTSEELPIAKMLQGATWMAGRELAFLKRPHGVSPFTVLSDATVF